MVELSVNGEFGQTISRPLRLIDGLRFVIVKVSNALHPLLSVISTLYKYVPTEGLIAMDCPVCPVDHR
mgnify:CR=1 FL=1